MSKFEIKDLINIGVFAVLYFVIVYAVGMTQVIPIMFPLSPILMGVLGGIPLMLFITRVNKFGMLTILGIISSILVFLGGMSYLTVITGLIFPIIGDYIMKLGDYKEFSKIAIGTGVFSLWVFGAFAALWLFRDAQMEMITMGMGPEYANALFSYIPQGSMVLYMIAVIIAGIIGAYVGRIILRKHFERAGIA